MSGTTTMYTLKPIIQLPCVLEHSETMYRMRNIHEDERMVDHQTTIRIADDVKEQVTNFLKSPLPEYAMLEARQEKILAQLAELKKQVSTLCDFLKPTKPVEDCVINKQPINVTVVINVSPKRPPYSILALQNVWKDTSIRIQPYTHSTITGEVPVIYPLPNNASNASNCNTINLDVIWKEVDSLEFISGLRNYHLVGEVNLLRYLSRLINIHNYEKDTSSVKPEIVDAILDLCHCLQLQESSKNTQEILSQLEDIIGKETLLDKRTPSIADIAAWSVIKQISPKKLPSDLNKWYDICNRIFT